MHVYCITSTIIYHTLTAKVLYVHKVRNRDVTWNDIFDKNRKLKQTGEVTFLQSRVTATWYSRTRHFLKEISNCLCSRYKKWNLHEKKEKWVKLHENLFSANCNFCLSFPRYIYTYVCTFMYLSYLSSLVNGFNLSTLLSCLKLYFSVRFSFRRPS